MTADGEKSSDSDVEMAECGACRAVIPLNSKSCPSCNVSFSGVAEGDMGECGACGTLVAIDSKSCPQCGVHFVLDDLTTALSIWMKEEGMNIADLFAEIDTDSDESLTSSEIKEALLARNLAFLGAKELDRFLEQIDLNHDGVISYAELAAALSMPWNPPEEIAVLEPEEASDDESDTGDAEEDEEDSDDEEEDEEDSDDEEEDEEDSDDEEEEAEAPQYTERVLKRVMKTYGITDKEGFLAHASTFDKDGNNFLKEPELTEAAKSWKSGSDAVEEVEEETDEEVEEETDEEVEEETDEEVEEDDGGDLPFKDIESEEDQFTDDDDSKSKMESSSSDGPAEWQRFLMRHYENVFPILYTLGALFIGLWVVNAMGLIVDGSGGPIAYNGDTPRSFDMDGDGFIGFTESLSPGEIYPCDNDIQVGGCKNSLTPFSGVNGASSMPAGFHLDGIIFMLLGLVGIGGIAFLQMKIKQLREQHRRKKKSSDDEEKGEDEDSDDEEEEDEEDSDDEEEEDEEDSDDEEEEDEEESDDEEEDEIDIGTRVGVEDGDDEWFGIVVEFDEEDDDIVVVKREDDDEEYEVEWDSLFMPDDE
ncbi:MAG: EF-hand domain-containing protein [Candidatus Thermoplasmatota archaeon]|nr:EF-hand domain-containing protein [Candidatus Thermoplasmatota archaeon]